MPTYEYECEKCNRTFEAEQRITDQPLDECIVGACKGRVRRLIQRTSFSLKGGGWFKTGGY